jgi:hypothetical protein
MRRDQQPARFSRRGSGLPMPAKGSRRLIGGGTTISQEMADRVFQDLRLPVDPVQVGIRHLQQQIAQLVGVEHAAVEKDRKDGRLQPEAHTASTCSSWPRSLSSVRAERRLRWRSSRSSSTSWIRKRLWLPTLTTGTALCSISR